MYTRIFAWRWCGGPWREITAPAWFAWFVREWVLTKHWLARKSLDYRDVIMP